MGLNTNEEKQEITCDVVQSKLVITGSSLARKYLFWEHIGWWEYIQKTVLAFHEKLVDESPSLHNFLRQLKICQPSTRYVGF